MQSFHADYFIAHVCEAGVEVEGRAHCLFGIKELDGAAYGVYSEWKWDGTQLEILSDYSGYYSLYYYASQNAIMVSNSILKLIALGAPAEYDQEAIAVFCRCGFYVDDKTPFRQIRAIPPSAAIRWSHGDLRVKGRARIPRLQSLSAREAVDGYIELFRKAVERYSRSLGEFGLPLTGGRDSRQLLFELNRQGNLPSECVTCGDPRDVAIARNLADRLGIRHKAIFPKRSWVNNMWRKNLGTHFCAIEHTWLMVLGDYVGENHEEIFEGTGVGSLTRGDLSNASAYSLCKEGKWIDIAERAFGEIGPSESLYSMLPDKFVFLKNSREQAIDTFAKEIKKYSDAANPIKMMFYWNWNRRAIGLSPFAILSRTCKVNTPFMDQDLFDHVSSIPPEVCFEQEPQEGAIKRAFPEYSSIPFYNDLPRVPQKRGISLKLRNTIGRYAHILQKCPSSIVPFLKVQLRSKTRDRSAQETLLMYLSELEYCSNKDRAAQAIEEYEDSWT